jgi:prolyl-tRNA synthetase
MCHGDQDGLRIPPRIAHIQVVVLVVRDDDAGTVTAEARRVADELRAAGVRVRVDDQTSTGFGRRVTDWELKGVPVRVEIGPRDVGEGVVSLARRDQQSKETVPAAGLAERVTTLLEDIQTSLLEEATAFRDSRTTEVTGVEEALEAARTGFAVLPWSALGDDGEDRLAAEGVTVRCLQRPDGTVPDDYDEGDLRAIVARAY